ncbi:hypothetical protein CLOHAE12215_02058 [Clostridium haemolyticum]|nr:Hypothetical UPF0297 protein [Clostridium botulinum BKT015925]CAG7840634.1 hypothetical protein CLOHAE12215_02058 [Clostridium haemolyticum]
MSLKRGEAGMSINENTMEFDIQKNKDDLTRNILTQVNDSLKEKGYNPINQLVGYLISGDPTYITNYNGARALIRKLERDEILEEVLKAYLSIK